MLAVGIVVGLAGGFLLGNLSSSGNPLPGKTGSYQEGFDEAHRLLLESGLIAGAPEELTSIAGEIVSIEGDIVTLSAPFASPDPLDTRTYPSTRTVTVTDGTDIVLVTDKDPEAFLEELSAFLAANPEGGPGTEGAPEPSVVESGALSDLQLGDRVLIHTEEDILMKDSFTAIRIERTEDIFSEPVPGEGPEGVPGV